MYLYRILVWFVLTELAVEVAPTSSPRPPFHYEVEVASRRAVPVQSRDRLHSLRGVINYQAMPTAQVSAPIVVANSAFGTVPPGGVCSQDQECAGNPFSYCMGTCMCRDGAINGGSTCLEPGSTSKGNCGTGQVYISEAGACMNSARPGEPCQYSQQCSGVEVGAFCVNLRCRCVYGMVVTGDGRCTFINSNCTTRGTVWISELGECKPVIAPGARTCTHRQQCIASYPDSMCFLTQCTCPEGQPVAVDGTCGTSCQPGQTFSGVLGKCVPTVQPGDRCQYSSQCHAIYPGMICDRGVCRCPNNQMWTGSACSANCPSGYMMNPKSGMCRPICRSNQIDLEGECLDLVGPGQPCQMSQQCQGGSTCANQLCTCPAGTQNLMGSCSRTSSPPGGQCNSGEYCVGGSYCENGLCTCPQGTVKSNQQCVTPANVPPGTYCHHALARCSGGSRCINGICTCQNGQAILHNRCVPIKVLSPGCLCSLSQLDQQCTGGSRCMNGTCVCPGNTVPFGEECVIRRRVPPLSSCAAGETCSGGSICQNGVCTCPSGMVIKNQQCEHPSRVLPGNPCPTGTEICTGGSTCTNGVCHCPAGQIVRDQFCSVPPPVPYHFLCSTDGECVGGATCINGVCVCPNSTLLVDGICQMPVMITPSPASLIPTTPSMGKTQTSSFLGGFCQDGEGCLGGSMCEKNICVCPPKTIPIANRCVKTIMTVAPGSACSNGETCGGGSVCISGQCVCPPTYTAVNGACRPTAQVPPTASCANGERCTGGSTCIKDVCTCPADQVVINQRCQDRPVVPPDSSCLNGEVCGGGSVCSQGKCTCPAGTAQSGRSCKNVFMSSKTQNCPLPDDPTGCALPDCYCSSSGQQIPGNLTSSETPQMVLLTVDDALNGRTMTYIRHVFQPGRYKNPNGCEVKGTFFVSHEWNNYDEVQWLHFHGHEIAVNSITHQTLSNETVERWSSEMIGMRTILQQLGGVPSESVIGVRAPQLAVGGNSQFEMMRQDGFQYDNSISANPGKNGPAYWPQTLDFQLPWRCEIEPCPDRSFPGIWVIPINQFYGYYLPEIQDHKRGAMVRAVMADAPEETVDSLYNTLMDNFNRVYRTNRAPYVITLDAAFFQMLPNNGSMEALERFITQILQTPDVWMVTAKQALEWMKKPTATSQLSSLEPWQCAGTAERQRQQQQQHIPSPCEAPQRCSYRTQLPFGERWFKTCFTCPSTYPWLNNPTGTRHK